MLRLTSSVCALAVASALLGCGGANDSDLFSGNPSNTQKDASTVDVVVQQDTGAPDASPDNVTPPPPPLDAGPPDVAPPPVTAPIVCGKTLATASLKCDANNDVCCRSGSGVSMTVQCTADGNCQNDGDVSLGCSSTATCTALGLVNNVCCGTLVQGSGSFSVVASSTCVPANQCPNGNGTVRLCDKGGPNVCTNGLTCKTSAGSLPGYDLCLP